jgi:hypothetical protein
MSAFATRGMTADFGAHPPFLYRKLLVQEGTWSGSDKEQSSGLSLPRAPGIARFSNLRT